MNNQKPSQAGRVVLTVLLAIFLLVSALATVLVAELRCLTRKETLKTVITQVVTSSGSTDSSGTVSSGSTGSSGSGTVVGDLMDNLCDYAAEEINTRLGTQVASQEVRELLAESTLPEFLAEKISSSLSGEPSTVTQQEVQTLLDDNREVIEKALGQPLSEDMEQKIMDWAAKYANDMVDQIQDGLTHGPAHRRGVAVVPAAAAPSAFSVISAASAASVKALVIGVVMCLVWTALLLVVNRRFLATGLCVSGAMYLVAGALCALVLLVAAPQFGIPVQPMLPPMLVVLGLALVLLISGIVLGILKKKKEKAVA